MVTYLYNFVRKLHIELIILHFYLVSHWLKNIYLFKILIFNDWPFISCSMTSASVIRIKTSDVDHGTIMIVLACFQVLFYSDLSICILVPNTFSFIVTTLYIPMHLKHGFLTLNSYLWNYFFLLIPYTHFNKFFLLLL